MRDLPRFARYGARPMRALELEQVQQVAALSALELTDAEARVLADELGAVVQHMQALSAVDVTGVEPTVHPVPLGGPGARRPRAAVVAARPCARGGSGVGSGRLCRTQGPGRRGLNRGSACRARPVGDRAVARPWPRAQLSAAEVTRAYLDRIERFERVAQRLSCTSTPAGALAPRRGASIARAPRARRSAPLAGVPVALKDNLCTRGMPTTCASSILEGYVPPYDAHVVERLRAAGAVVHRQAQHGRVRDGLVERELGVRRRCAIRGTSTRAPGGSSGGAAAATAARLAAARARQRHRRLGAPARELLRRDRDQADLRARLALRAGRVRVVARPGRADRARRARRGAAAVGDRGPRPARRDERRSVAVDDYEAECGSERARPARRRAARRHRGLRARRARGARGDASTQLRSARLRVVRGRAAAHRARAVACTTSSRTAEASSNLARFDGMRYGLRVRGEDLRDTYAQDARGGLRPRGQAPHHARHVRALGRLLRRLLPEGAEACAR